jgi:hypothetical protein
VLYQDRRVECYFIHGRPEAQLGEIRSWLEESGLGKARGWMKFTRARAALTEIRRTNLIIHPAAPSDEPAIGWFLTDLSPELAGWLPCFVGAKGWHICMSFGFDKPAATGGLFVQGNIAYCDWGAAPYRPIASAAAKAPRCTGWSVK